MLCHTEAPRRPRSAGAASTATGRTVRPSASRAPIGVPFNRGSPASRGEKLAGRSSLVEALADAPTTMLGAAGPRTPLDDLLADAVHAARQHQVRAEQVELVEIALLSFAGLDAETLAEQVRQFRSDTNRYVTSRR